MKAILITLVTLIVGLMVGCGDTTSNPSEGVFGTKWGTEGTGEGQFSYPSGIAVAPDGSVYVDESSNHKIPFQNYDV